MPIFMDRHYAEEATQNTLALAHSQDLAIQAQFDVKFLTYWFDEARHTAFCLVDAPNKQAIVDAHNAAHGDIPHEIIEVDPAIVSAFLGRVADPVSEIATTIPEVDSAFRGVMFTDLQDSTLLTSTLGDGRALHQLHIHNALIRKELRRFDGREVKHTGDGFMVSFNDVDAMVNCATQIQVAFGRHNAKAPEHPLQVRIGLSAGEPIEEHGDLFGASVQLSARLCAEAAPGQILVSSSVKNNVNGEHRFERLGDRLLKGFSQPVSVYSFSGNLTRD